jgi:hypothetical protein
MPYKKFANLPTRAITPVSALAALDIILTTIPLIPYGPSAGVIVKPSEGIYLGPLGEILSLRADVSAATCYLQIGSVSYSSSIAPEQTFQITTTLSASCTKSKSQMAVGDEYLTTTRQMATFHIRIDVSLLFTFESVFPDHHFSITRKYKNDAKDLIVLPSDHEIGRSGEKETVNVGYVSDILSND